MKALTFDTSRLKCRPLVREDYNDFIHIVTTDSAIKEFFALANLSAKLWNF